MCISFKVHSLMSEWELYTQLFAGNWRCGRFARCLSQGCSEKIRKKDDVMTAGRWSSWSIQVPQFLTLVSCDESLIYCCDPETKRQSSQWKYAGSPRPKKARQSKSTHNFLMISFLTALPWSTCTGFPLDRQSTRNTMLRFQGSSARDSVGRGQHSSNRVHNSRLFVTDYLTKMDIKTLPQPPYSPDLAPYDFSYSLSSEAVVMRQLRRWKRLWRRSLTRSHKRTSIGPSRSCSNGTTSALQPEEITSKGTRVSCVYYQ